MMGDMPATPDRSSDGFPIFLLGSGRSGTTLLQKILNSAEGVMVWGEHGGFLKQVAESYYFSLTNEEIDRQIFRQNPVAKDPNLDFDRLKLKKIGYCWINWYGKQVISRNFARFIESFFYPDSLRKSHWGFKEIRYGVGDRVMEMLADLYPDARFVFIVRDPIDVLASQVAMGWSAGWKELAEKWAVQNQSILNFCHTHGDRTRLVRFEDLILKESSTIDELFAWLGFEVSDKQRAILDIEEGIWRKTRDDGMPHRTMFSDRKLRRILRIVKAPKNALGY